MSRYKRGYLKFKEESIQFSSSFFFSFKIVCVFFFSFRPKRKRTIPHAVIIRCFDSGGYYISSCTATFGNRFCIKGESESAIRSRLECRAVMRTRQNGKINFDLGVRSNFPLYFLMADQSVLPCDHHTHANSTLLRSWTRRSQT